MHSCCLGINHEVVQKLSASKPDHFARKTLSQPGASVALSTRPPPDGLRGLSCSKNVVVIQSLRNGFRW